MAQINLENEEIEVLTQVLESKLADLSYEIADTDLREFKDQLKSRRARLNNILHQLKDLSD